MHLLKRIDRRALGEFIIVSPGELDDGGQTMMCPHCQMHFVVEPGSGHARGWCYKCSGVTCGKEACEGGCNPWERQIEQIEKHDRLLRQIAEALMR